MSYKTGYEVEDDGQLATGPPTALRRRMDNDSNRSGNGAKSMPNGPAFAPCVLQKSFSFCLPGTALHLPQPATTALTRSHLKAQDPHPCRVAPIYEWALAVSASGASRRYGNRRYTPGSDALSLWFVGWPPGQWVDEGCGSRLTFGPKPRLLGVRSDTDRGDILIRLDIERGARELARRPPSNLIL